MLMWGPLSYGHAGILAAFTYESNRVFRGFMQAILCWHAIIGTLIVETKKWSRKPTRDGQFSSLSMGYVQHDRVQLS